MGPVLDGFLNKNSWAGANQCASPSFQKNLLPHFLGLVCVCVCVCVFGKYKL